MPVYDYDFSSKLNSSCYDTDRGGKSVILLVCHSTAGPNDKNTPGQSTALSKALSDAAANYLCSNDRTVSAHYVIGAEACGAPIYRIVPESATAFHAGGDPPQFPSKWVDPVTGATTGRYPLNQQSIGVEVFGQSNDVIGPNQKAAISKLVADIASRYPDIKRPGHTVSHASLEADRDDGKNWLQIALDAMQNAGTTDENNPPAPDIPSGFSILDANTWKCDVTGQTLAFRARDFWVNHGGLRVFGYPLTDWQDVKQPDGSTKKVKYFERARFEQRPNIASDTPSDQCFDLGLLGTEALTAQYATPALDSVLKTAPVVVAASTNGVGGH